LLHYTSISYSNPKNLRHQLERLWRDSSASWREVP
jgi:hypothetical protein